MSVYLSRLTFDSRHRRTKSELQRPYELHRTICKAWDDPAAARILLRPEADKPGVVYVIVQSLTEPDWSRLPGERNYLREVEGPKRVELKGIREGLRLRFRLRCRPTKRIGDRDSPDCGKRKSLTGKEEIFDWLRRKGESHGFEPLEVGFERVYWQDTKNGPGESVIGAVVFDGLLAVTDPDKLREAVRGGIGTQKAYGFGLLSIAPAG
jgi:CRISPR system Cascade subunit CasE